MTSLLKIDPYNPYAGELVRVVRQMTPVEIAFVEELMVDADEEHAAAAVGLAPNKGRSFAKRHYVKEAIRLLRLERSERLDARADKVVAEMAKLAFVNMGDYLAPNSEGDMTVKVPRGRDELAALSEVQVDTYMEGRGDEARPVKRTRVKVHDKLASLNALARHLGMFVDRAELSVDMDVRLRNMTRAERLQMAYELLEPYKKFLTKEELAGRVIEHEDGGKTR